MYSARQHSCRRWRRFGGRRVTRLAAVQQPMARDDDLSRLLAYRNGLWAAELLQRHFPERFARHVAPQPVTLQGLACVLEYFLILAHHHLIAIDEGWADINLYGDPDRALTASRTLTDAEAISLLAEELSHVLLDPFPCCWGLPREWESLFSAYGALTHNLLLLAVWRLVSETAWAYDEGVYEDSALLDEAFSADALAAIQALPKLPPATPMDRLCDRLDTAVIALAADGAPIRGLGATIRYCLRRTGNGYADYSAEIIAEDFGGQVDIDFWSSDEDLREHRAAQQAAEALYRQYADLDALLCRTPALLATLGAVLLQTAAELDTHPAPATPPAPQEPPTAREAELVTKETTMPVNDSPTARAARERPWIRRRAQPQRLPPEDILMNGARPEAQISVFRDGTTLLTRRDGGYGYRCYPIAPAALAQTLAHVPMSAGALVPNTVGAGWINGQPWYCVYVPPHARTLRALVREQERSYSFELPPLIWWGWSRQCRIWALAEAPLPGALPAPDTQLYAAPFPNCRADGSICWGAATAPAIASAADLLPALERFLQDTYFNDHLASDKSRRYPVNVLLAWAAITGGGSYPLDDLVPANVGTRDRPLSLDLRQIINAEWRVG